jgi:hypothetical protein
MAGTQVSRLVHRACIVLAITLQAASPTPWKYLLQAGERAAGPGYAGPWSIRIRQSLAWLHLAPYRLRTFRTPIAAERQDPSPTE